MFPFQTLVNIAFLSTVHKYHRSRNQGSPFIPRSQESSRKFMVSACVTQSCLTLCKPVDCSPPGSSVHGILQTRILQWIAMLSSRGSSQSRDQSQVSCISCIAGGFFTTGTTWEAHGGVEAQSGALKEKSGLHRD